MDGNKEEARKVEKTALEEQPRKSEDKFTELCRKKPEFAVLDGDKKGAEDVQKEDQTKEGERVKANNNESKGKDPEVIALYNTDEDGESDSTTFLDDLGSGQTSTSDDDDCDDETDSEAPLTDAEVEELVAEFLEVESKAAEAQESLEKESLANVESDVRAELAETLHGDELEKAVTTEMETFREYWETALDDLETQGALLLEQLDGSGIELPSLYKWIESQVPNGCCTEAWKTRAHWVGSQVSTEVNQSVREAEAYLQSCRPVRRQHGKLLEEGASGYLARKLSVENTDSLARASDKDWSSFNSLIQSSSSESNSFGSKKWASVYLASTPQQAANLGLKLPGIDEVEEIGEIDSNSGDPFFADAIANENEINLSEEQKKNFKKVKEEEDVNLTKKHQQHLKRRRQRNKNYEPVAKEILDGTMVSNECSQSFSENLVLSENGVNNFDCGGIADQFSNSHMENVKTENTIVNSTCKRLRDDEDVEIANKRSKTVVIESDDDVQVLEDKSSSIVPYRNQGSPPQNTKVIDIIDVEKLPSPCGKFTYRKDEYKDYYCTSCSGLLTASEVQKHPVLGVIVCKSCKILVEEKKASKDPSDAYCIWCGWGLELIKCNSCEMWFCVICLVKNFGDKGLSDARCSGWQCCCCSPVLLQRLTLEFEKAVRRVPHASSDSEAEILDALIDGSNSDKKRLKKRIRRILDDTELGDETKQKIAVEKARQEHLKSMHEQSVGKSRVTHITTIKGNSRDGAADAAEGYIVNVAREGDEEIVRIPLSISSKLKPHQVAGIRFMWENVIQSVGKAKSGDKGLGCILAHTMGLGKTFQVIAFLYVALRGVDLGLKTALVVTPVNVLHNWRREFEKWKPHEYKRLRVVMLEDVARERRAELLAKWKSKGGVLLIGYAAFRNLSFGKYVKDRNAANEICHALQYGPDVLVCDEAHMIKNTKADITQALKQVNTQRRIALTGSPLQNNLMEYYCMVDFVREGFLGSSLEFRNRFQNPIENGQHKNSTNADVKIMNQRSHILYEQLKGFVQRMGINVVKNDLPPKTVFVITVKLSPLQKKLYKRFLDAHGFTSDKVSSDKTLKRGCFFSGYQALAQISNHPGLLQMTKKNKYQQRREDAVENFVVEDCSSDDNVDYTELLNGEKQRTKTDLAKKSDSILNNEEPDWWEELLDEKIYKEVNYSGKMVLLLDILSMCSELGDKALVFSQSLTTLDLIEKYLSKLPHKGKEGYWKQGKDWYRLDGSTDGSERQNLVEKFNEPTNTRVKCTLISTRAGSLGINLHAANRVILVDGSWNPTYDLQAIFRVWRYGQNKPVYAYRLMAQKTMEEKVYKRQVSKEGLAARVVDRQQVFRTMSREEILHLFEFGDDDNPEMSEMIQNDPELSKQQTTVDDVGPSDINSFLTPDRARSSDEILENLLKRHSPGWIAKYHEHESLLQENEADRLTKEEQDMAWQTYQRSLIDWQEVHRTDLADHETKEAENVIIPEGSIVPRETKRSHPIQRKAVSSVVSEGNEPLENKSSAKSHPAQRKCSNLNHLLTLRSKGTKSGGSTICGECMQEISWETLNKSK